MSDSHYQYRLSPVCRGLVWLLIPLMTFGPGCSRPFFRDQADKEGLSIMAEKTDPLWDLKGYWLYPDVRARFADTTNPDRPPMPPDDPAARALSPNPQKPPKEGITLVEGVGYLDMLDCFDRQNRAELEARRLQKQQEEEARTKQSAETKSDDPKDLKLTDTPEAGSPPSPQAVLERAEELARRELAEIVTTNGIIPEKEAEKAVSQQRTFLIKLEQAVELGLVNSREYQTRREQLFLAALPVSVERFAFMPQFLAAESVIRERLGRGTSDGYANRWSGNSVLGMSKLFSTGALLLLRFANRTVFNIGTRPETSISSLSLDLIQPFLRGGGKAVTLEPLTQTERNLLYAVRDFAKFRQEFFVFIASGQATFIPGVQAGVQALTGGTVSLPGRYIPGAVPVVSPLISLGFVGPQVTPGDGIQLVPSGVGTAPPQGYLSTLGEKAQLVNQYRNIQSLRRYLELFRVYLEGGIVNSVQVGQVEQQLLNSIDSALSQQANFRNSVDQFKFQLGLPMNIRIEVDDDPLMPMFNVSRAYEDLSSQYEKVSYQASQYVRATDVNQLRGRLRALLLQSAFVRDTEFRGKIGARLDSWRKRNEKQVEAEIERLQKRRAELQAKQDRLKDQEKGDLSKEELAEFEDLADEIALGQLERNLLLYERRIWQTEKDEAQRLALQNRLYLVVYRYFLAVLEEPFRERMEKVKKLWPVLPALCIDGVDLLRDDDDVVMAAATRAALANRLDLMNQRAQLVDSWRKIAVAANALLGTFNVQYHFETSTPAAVMKPFNFGYNRTKHQVFLDYEAPLVRIQERNNYRAALIAYQQQRRALQVAEDQVIFAVRLELRQLRAAANNYHKVQKRAVELAYQQVDQALQAFSQPQAPAGPAAPPGSVGAPSAGGGTGDPAALTQQLLQTQNSLLRAQNALYNTWINYLTTRMSLYRDLGIMPLDPRGVWIDEVATCQCRPESSSSNPTNGTTDGRSTDQLPAPRPVPSGDGRPDKQPDKLPQPRPDGESGKSAQRLPTFSELPAREPVREPRRISPLPPLAGAR